MNLKCLNIMDYNLVSKALQYLIEVGYSDLIEKKKEKEVIACLKEKYPDMDNATLKEVLNCVIF